MANDIIQKHNFELAKNRILSASRNVPYTGLNSFPTEGSIFSFNEHNITGDEANRLLINPLQKNLKSQNTCIKDLFNIAKDVYNALESLDKEYIFGIIGTVQVAKAASDQAATASTQAKQASEKALDASKEALAASEKATNAQADIKRTIEALQKTVNILKEFKLDVSARLNSLTSIQTQITDVNTQIKSVEQENNNVMNAIKSLQSANTLLNNIVHLWDIDTIWNDVESHKTNLLGLHEQVDSFISEVDEATQRITTDIIALKEYRSKLESYAHIDDIDTIWNDVESHKTNLAGLHEQLNKFAEDTNNANAKLHEKIDNLTKLQEIKNQYIDKKIKIAYGIAGGSIVFSLIQFVLQILGIL